MLRRDGIVKVLDFGLAKLVEQTPLDAEAETRMQVQTQAGLIVGTAAYMSPEQARGIEVDARTDFFSIGVVMYEMLAGQSPFVGETTSDVIAAILTTEPKPPSSFNQEIPAELDRIVNKTLAKKRDERYRNAKDLLADLRQLQRRLEFKVEAERELGVTRSTAKSDLSATQNDEATSVSTTEPRNSIAVLPFTNLSADPENEYFCDGLAEELLNALAKIDRLKVAARTSTFSFKGKNAPVSEIAKALNVNTIMEGSVRKSGNRVRITAQVINAADGYHLWSERYDREMKDIFDVQDEITLAVVEALKGLHGANVKPLPSRHVFAHDDGTPLENYELISRWGKVRKAAGLSNVRWHDLRHASASFLIQNGASLAEVAHQLGHLNVATSARYAHLVPGVKPTGADKLNEKLSG